MLYILLLVTRCADFGTVMNIDKSVYYEKIKSSIESFAVLSRGSLRDTRNSVNNEIKLAKKAYYMRAFHENESNVKKTWGIINEQT